LFVPVFAATPRWLPPRIVSAEQVAGALARCSPAYDFGDVINELLETTKGGFAVQQL
jgi:hypothetical protein